MKIVHLSSVHPAGDTRIFEKECQSLVQAGYQVSLIAKAAHDSVINGVKVCAIPESTNRLQRMSYIAMSVYKKALIEKGDIYHFHDPELIPVGLLLRLAGKKVIYDVHEDLPRQLLSKPWIPKWARFPISYIISMIEAITARLFLSAIIAATPTIARRFPVYKTATVRNYPKLDEFSCSESASYAKRPLNIVYVGGITRIRGVIENINAFEYVNHKNARLLLAGRFEDAELESQCRQLSGWKAVDYKGWLGRTELAHMLANSRIGLVLLHPIINYLDAYPVKLFEYMATGIPVIASDFPLWRKIVESSQCGFLVDPMKPKEIAKAIDWLLENQDEAEQMGKNGRNAVMGQYNWACEEGQLLELYRGLSN